MKFIKLQSPGSLCNSHAIKWIIKRNFSNAKTFVDIGCGGGDLSKDLLAMNLQGLGIDFSEDAIEAARINLQQNIVSGQYRLLLGDITKDNLTEEQYDFGISSMVMEHVEDDIAFVRKCCSLIKPGGYFIFGVPSRSELWSIEDNTVGHLRRYERNTLLNTLLRGGIKDPKVYSVAVPISNCLFGLSKMILSYRKKKEPNEIDLSKVQQTQSSGIREIPWKTVFPFWAKIFFNPLVLFPLLLLQHLFYNTNLGVIMIGWGQVSDNNSRSN